MKHVAKSWRDVLVSADTDDQTGSNVQDHNVNVVLDAWETFYWKQQQESSLWSSAYVLRVIEHTA